MSTARSRQLPLASFRVRTGSWIPFSCRATCLKVRLMVCVMSTRRSRVLADPSSRRKLAAQRSSLGCGTRRDEARETGPIFRRVGKRIGPGKILDIGCAEAGRRVVETNGAFEAKLRGPVRETGGRDMIAEDILRPGKLARLRA